MHNINTQNLQKESLQKITNMHVYCLDFAYGTFAYLHTLPTPTQYPMEANKNSISFPHSSRLGCSGLGLGGTFIFISVKISINYAIFWSREVQPSVFAVTSHLHNLRGPSEVKLYLLVVSAGY